jgi:pimeloyl-ACP methyl ester carboxylesterase
MSDLTIWQPQLAPVGKHYRTIAYSRRYAWPNAELPLGAPDMMQPHVEDLLAFLRALGAYPAHLVGNSWGAFICLRAAIQQPAAVQPRARGAPARPAEATAQRHAVDGGGPLVLRWALPFWL